MNNITLLQMADEYDESNLRLRRRIKELRKLYRENPTLDLQVRINLLYQEAYDCKCIAKYLRNYYKGKKK